MTPQLEELWLKLTLVSRIEDELDTAGENEDELELGLVMPTDGAVDELNTIGELELELVTLADGAVDELDTTGAVEDEPELELVAPAGGTEDELDTADMLEDEMELTADEDGAT